MNVNAGLALPPGNCSIQQLISLTWCQDEEHGPKDSDALSLSRVLQTRGQMMVMTSKEVDALQYTAEVFGRRVTHGCS